MTKTRKQPLAPIGDRLLRLRRQLNLSKDEMAAHCGLTGNGYAKNERGDNLPNIDSLYRLSKNFDISMDWLLFDRGPVHYADKGAIITPPGTAGPAVAEEHPVEGSPIPGPVDSPELIPVMADIKRLLTYMAVDPQFRYEVLGYFFKYLKDHPQP